MALNPTSTVLLLTGALIGAIGVIKMLPHMRRFEAEGRRVGFDFHSTRYFMWFFRPAILPEGMREPGRKLRSYGIRYLWTAFFLMLAAFILDEFVL